MPTIDPAMAVQVIIAPDLDYIIRIHLDPCIYAVIWALGFITYPHDVDFLRDHVITKKSPKLIGQRTKEIYRKVRRTLPHANVTTFSAYPQ
jgi:hypothetical protein